MYPKQNSNTKTGKKNEVIYTNIKKTNVPRHHAQPCSVMPSHPTPSLTQPKSNPKIPNLTSSSSYPHSPACSSPPSHYATSHPPAQSHSSHSRARADARPNSSCVCPLPQSSQGWVPYPGSSIHPRLPAHPSQVSTPDNRVAPLHNRTRIRLADHHPYPTTPPLRLLVDEDQVRGSRVRR